VTGLALARGSSTRLRSGPKERAVDPHVGRVAASEELGVVAVERSRDRRRDGRRAGYPGVAVNNDPLDLRAVLLDEIPDLSCVHGGKQVALTKEIRRRLGIGKREPQDAATSLVCAQVSHIVGAARDRDDDVRNLVGPCRLERTAAVRENFHGFVNAITGARARPIACRVSRVNGTVASLTAASGACS